MKRVVGILAFALCLLAGAQAANAGIVGDLAKAKAYSVNIIAYEICPKAQTAQRIAVLADFTDDVQTGESYVTLDKRNKIFLTPGGDFRVLDSLACDSNGATLQLPPGTGDDFQIWVRLVGKPNSGISAYLCRSDDADTVDPADDTIVCSASQYTRTRLTGKGQPSFTNATSQLLHVGSESLFDEELEDYFWVWNTTGRPHAQVWFIDWD